MKVETVPMFGPSLSDPSKIVNRDVPKADVEAYRGAGYREGTIAVEEPLVYTLEDAIAQNDGVDVTAEKPKRRGNK